MAQDIGPATLITTLFFLFRLFSMTGERLSYTSFARFVRAEALPRLSTGRSGSRRIRWGCDHRFNCNRRGINLTVDTDRHCEK
jgi:hypothetical protein